MQLSPPRAADIDPVTIDMPASQDPSPMVTDDLSTSGRQMSEESVTSAESSLVCGDSSSGPRPASGTQPTVHLPDTLAHLDHSSKPEFSRPSSSSSHGSNNSVKPDPDKPHRLLKPSNQVGRRKHLSGASSKSLQ